jgi:hypothetical protein
MPIKFIATIIFHVFEACKTILLYTKEHLSNRQYDKKTIATLDIVQIQLAETTILLSQINTMIPLITHSDQCHFIIEKMISALSFLSRLGGARAILKNNAIELMFYLKVFDRFIQQ